MSLLWSIVLSPTTDYNPLLFCLRYFASSITFSSDRGSALGPVIWFTLLHFFLKVQSKCGR